VVAALSREEDDEGRGPVNGSKDRVGSERYWAILKLETKINNTKPVGLPGVFGLNQFGPCRRMEKKFSNFLQVFIYFYLNQRVFKYFQIKFLNWISKCNKIK
jgi:hypothetical protein